MCENYGVRLPGAEVAWRMCTKYHQITSGRCVCVCLHVCVNISLQSHAVLSKVTFKNNYSYNIALLP